MIWSSYEYSHMPPHASLSSQDGHYSASSSMQSREPYYTNTEIEVLNEIVLEAQEILPTLDERERLPTNALFYAADKVLPKHGYDPDSTHFSRILFKIGGSPAPGNIRDKFAKVLEKMGIELEFVPDETESRRSPSVASTHRSGVFPVSPHYNGRRRRNSASAAEPAADTFHTETPTRARSHSFQSTAEHGPLDARLQAVGISHAHRDTRHPDTRAWLDHHDDASEYDEGSRNIPFSPSAAGETELSRQSPHSGLGSEEFRGASDTTVQTFDASPDHPDTELYGVVLEKRIQLFQQHRSRFVARDVLRDWLVSAQVSEDRRQQCEPVADYKDLEAVASEVVGIWLEQAEISHDERVEEARAAAEAAAEAERMAADDARAEKMLRRAGRAHDICLAFKAFTHWQSCAQEEVERTALARRHLLRKKIFGGWCKYRADNLARVNQFVLSNAVRVWRGVHSNYRSGGQDAQLCHRQLSSRQTVKAWILENRDRQSQERRMVYLKSHVFQEWALRVRPSVIGYDSAGSVHQLDLLQGCWKTWLDKASRASNLLQQSTESSRKSGCRLTLKEWHKAAVLNGTLRLALNNQEQASKAQALKIWNSRARQAAKAGAAARRQDLQRALLYWRYEQRSKNIQRRNRKRTLAVIVRNWQLEDRTALITRVYDERFAERAMLILHDASRDEKTWALQAAKRAKRADARHIGSHTCETWRRSARDVIALENLAASLDRTHKTKEVVALWSEQVSALQTQEIWVRRANFWFSAQITLGHWQNAAELAEVERLEREKKAVKERERAHRQQIAHAYWEYRRKAKISLAVNALQQWREATARIGEMFWDSEDMLAYRDEGTVIESVDVWREETEKMQVFGSIGTDAYLEMKANEWVEETRFAKGASEEAADYWVDRTLTKSWHLWELALLQQRSPLYTVANFQKNNNKRLCRHMMAYWYQQISAKGELPWGLVPTNSSLRRGTYTPVHRTTAPRIGSAKPSRLWPLPEQAEEPAGSTLRGFGTSVQLGPMSVFDEEEERNDDENDDDDDEDVRRVYSETPIPKRVIDTPSRWNSHARSFNSRLPSTTPSAPIPSPFERLLRDEPGGGAGSLPIRSRPVISVPRPAQRVSFQDVRDRRPRSVRQPAE